MKRICIYATVTLPLWACQLQPDKVTIGIALIESVHPGVVLAAEEINASGGIRGVPLELAGLEWKVPARFSPLQILELGNQLAADPDLVAVIGHTNSLATLSAAAFYNQAKIPQIVPTATNPSISNIGDWTYRICPSDAVQGPALAEHAYLDWGKRRLAGFFANDDYGRELAFRLEQRFEELGGEVVTSVPNRSALLEDDQAVIRATLKRLAESGFGGEEDLFVVVQFVTSGAAGWTLRAIETAGFKTDVLGADTMAARSMVDTFPVVSNRVRFSVFYLPLPNRPRAMNFHRAFEERYGISPDYLNAFAYEAVYLLRDAIEDGGFSREGVKLYLDKLIREQVEIEGLTNDYTLGSDHDANRGFHVVEVTSDRLLPIKAIGGRAD